MHGCLMISSKAHSPVFYFFFFAGFATIAFGYLDGGNPLTLNSRTQRSSKVPPHFNPRNISALLILSSPNPCKSAADA
eukprot:m.505929 g.505929  ORF g.505929 m.505929 type:complete len:78 (-) comp21868_c0_seq1:1679-1912(-)